MSIVATQTRWSWKAAIVFCTLHLGLSLGAQSADPGQSAWKMDDHPALPTGIIGEWDDWAIASPTILKLAEKWWMFYEGVVFDTKGVRSSFGTAESKDKLAWSKHSQNPLFTPRLSKSESCSLPTVTWWHDAFWAVYLVREDPFRSDLPVETFGDAPVAARVAHSDDGLNWHDLDAAKAPIHSRTPRTLVPCLYADGPVLHLWWRGWMEDEKLALFHSISRDGLAWSKPNAQPASEIDPRGFCCVRVYPSGDFYILSYVTEDRREERFFVATKSSRNARTWTADGPPDFPLKSHPTHAVPFTVFDPGGARLFYSEERSDHTLQLRSAYCEKKDYVSSH